MAANPFTPNETTPAAPARYDHSWVTATRTSALVTTRAADVEDHSGVEATRSASATNTAMRKRACTDAPSARPSLPPDPAAGGSVEVGGGGVGRALIAVAPRRDRRRRSGGRDP